MSRNNADGATETKNPDSDDPGQQGLSGRHKDRLPAAQEKDIARRERAIVDDEAAVLSREHAVMLRENAVRLREEAADSRKDTGNQRESSAAREQALLEREAEQASSEDRSTMMRQANSQLIVSVIEAQKLAEQIETAKTKLQHLAHHDVLTGLPNRMLLQDRLGQAIELAYRQGRRFAVLFMDLDRFKQFNDSLGHAVGDQLLRSVAQRLTDCLRHSDTISRQGGDEFVVLLSNIKQPEDAALIAQNMLAALTAPHLIDHHELHISVSIGISTYPNDGQDSETLLKSADSAMYHAKESGRNNYKFFEPDMKLQAVRRQSLEACLQRALERQEFMLHYQPKIDLYSNRIVGAEALIRWQHPEWGLVPPSQFMPIAEDCGLILPIGRWVLREACRQTRAWRQAGLPQITIAVNSSALEFGAKDFLENIRATLTDTCLEPRYLELELTESVLMRDAELTDRVLHALTDLGIKLVIDDFGTGYSSLSYLRQFPIDTLKIDQSFVHRMIGSPDDAAIVSAVIGLGKSLKLRLIAEGVETPEQHAFLVAQQCNEGQGYYFGHPTAAEAFATLLQAGLPRTLYI